MITKNNLKTVCTRILCYLIVNFCKPFITNSRRSKVVHGHRYCPTPSADQYRNPTLNHLQKCKLNNCTFTRTHIHGATIIHCLLGIAAFFIIILFCVMVSTFPRPLHMKRKISLSSQQGTGLTYDKMQKGKETRCYLQSCVS